MTSKGENYFASEEPKKTAGILLQKSSSFFNVLKANAYLEKIRSSWLSYYNVYGQANFGDAHEIKFTGEQGELVQLNVNHYRNLCSHILTMITANRPAMEARAVNTDYKSLSQTYLANGILDYYMREKDLEDVLKCATEMAVVMGSGFIKMGWNATAGEAYDADPETGEINYEGDIEFSNLSPYDVVVDGTRESWGGDWVLVRGRQNRFNLMAKYPELAENIKGIESVNQAQNQYLMLWSNDDTDDIFYYEFYHKKTEALPDGRYLLFLSEDTVLIDSPLPYPVVPVFRIAAAEVLGTPYAYSPMFDCLPIQDAVNAMYSAILTNENAFANQSIFIQRGADITMSSLDGGMNIIEGNSAPQPLNLTATSQTTFTALNLFVQTMETISGVNSVARGNPEASLKSGAALALVQSMALQFISGLQQDYVKLVEDVGTAIISFLKVFAKTPKVIALVGKHNRPLLKEFTGDDIAAISRVVVDIGNPLSKTTAGKVQMAEQLLQMQLIKTPNEYFQVLNTGNLDSMFEGEYSELLLIKSENEQLMEGGLVKALAIDEHKNHIVEHRSILADPSLRYSNSEVVKNVLDHINEHITLLRTTDAALLALIGEQALPPLPAPTGSPEQQAMTGAPPMPNGRPPVPGHGGPPPGHKGSSDQVLNPVGSAQLGANKLQGPGNPTNQNPSQSLPKIPHPPAPFNNLPVLATQVGNK